MSINWEPATVRDTIVECAMLLGANHANYSAEEFIHIYGPKLVEACALLKNQANQEDEASRVPREKISVQSPR